MGHIQRPLGSIPCCRSCYKTCRHRHRFQDASREPRPFLPCEARRSPSGISRTTAKGENGSPSSTHAPRGGPGVRFAIRCSGSSHITAITSTHSFGLSPDQSRRWPDEWCPTNSFEFHKRHLKKREDAARFCSSPLFLFSPGPAADLQEASPIQTSPEERRGAGSPPKCPYSPTWSAMVVTGVRGKQGCLCGFWPPATSRLQKSFWLWESWHWNKVSSMRETGLWHMSWPWWRTPQQQCFQRG